MTFPEPESPAWNAVWALLEAALKSHPIICEGNEAPSVKTDFMLMCVDGAGRANFKDVGSRQYIYVLPKGELVIPPGSSISFAATA